jgi:hypothetical protein
MLAQKWEASFQECQPTALGTVGTLVGTLDGTLEAEGAKDSVKLIGTGFAEPTFCGWTGYRTSSCTQGGLIKARKLA